LKRSTASIATVVTLAGLTAVVLLRPGGREDAAGDLPQDARVATECPALPDRSGDRWLAGNWSAVWSGVPEKKFFSRGQYFDTANLTIVAEDDGGLSISGPSWFRAGGPAGTAVPEDSAKVNTIPFESPSGNRIRTSLSFYSAPPSTLVANSASPDTLRGSWKIPDPDPDGRDFTGSVEWQRVRPDIRTIRVVSEHTVESPVAVADAPGDGWCGARLLTPAEPAKAVLTYDRDEWSDEFNRLRANRPQFSIELYGEDFWGTRWSGFDLENTGLEAMQPRYIRAEDDPGEIIGIRIRFNVWFGVQPGLYTLYVDDVAIPFELDIPNFYPDVSLRFVTYDPTNDTDRETDRLPVNQLFWVRASVTNPERFDDSQPLTLQWKGVEFSAVPRRISEGEYRAGPFYASDDLLPSTVVPPADPCEPCDQGDPGAR